MTNQNQLRKLMLDNRLTYQQTADISGYSLSTIRAYLLPITSKAHRNLSNRAYELITHRVSIWVAGKE